MGGDLVQERNKPNTKMLIAPTSPGLILIHPHALWHLGSIYMLARGNNHAFITTMGIDCHCWWCPQSHSPFILHQQCVSYHFNKCSVSSPWQSLTTSHFPSSEYSLKFYAWPLLHTLNGLVVRPSISLPITFLNGTINFLVHSVFFWPWIAKYNWNWLTNDIIWLWNDFLENWGHKSHRFSYFPQFDITVTNINGPQTMEWL